MRPASVHGRARRHCPAPWSPMRSGQAFWRVARQGADRPARACAWPIGPMRLHRQRAAGTDICRPSWWIGRDVPRHHSIADAVSYQCAPWLTHTAGFPGFRMSAAMRQAHWGLRWRQRSRGTLWAVRFGRRTIASSRHGRVTADRSARTSPFINGLRCPPGAGPNAARVPRLLAICPGEDKVVGIGMRQWAPQSWSLRWDKRMSARAVPPSAELTHSAIPASRTSGWPMCGNPISPNVPFRGRSGKNRR